MGRPTSLKKRAEALRKSMLESLEARGLTDWQYVDKVDEYIDFWTRRQQLRDDIQKRGVMVYDDKGRATENRSVSLEIQTSRQMLSIFQALGFKDIAVNAQTTGGDDDDL